jgi:hypothetical protein
LGTSCLSRQHQSDGGNATGGLSYHHVFVDETPVEPIPAAVLHDEPVHSIVTAGF